MTREDWNAYQRKWRKDNPDKVKAYNIKHPHKSGYSKAYYQRNREKIIQQVKERYYKNREELSKSRHDKYAMLHGEKIYIVTDPDGKETQYKTLQEVGDFMGYTAQYIHIVIEKNKLLFGYKIEKRIVV